MNSKTKDVKKKLTHRTSTYGIINVADDTLTNRTSLLTVFISPHLWSPNFVVWQMLESPDLAPFI